MKMVKKIICSDLDESLLDFMNPFLRFYNSKYGTFFRREQFKSFNLWETLGRTKEESDLNVLEFFESGYAHEMRPLEDSREVVEALSVSNGLMVLTARPEKARNLSVRSIDCFFPNFFSDIFFSDEWSNNCGKTKADICSELNAGYLIEDSLDNALACADVGTKVLLLDCPWNKYEDRDLPEGIERVYGWREIYGRLK